MTGNFLWRLKDYCDSTDVFACNAKDSHFQILNSPKKSSYTHVQLFNKL